MSRAAEKPPVLEVPPGRHDSHLRRRSLRSQRQRGCWIYIPAQDLLAAGISPGGPPPFYRTWPGRRGGLLVRLYKER